MPISRRQPAVDVHRQGRAYRARRPGWMPSHDGAMRGFYRWAPLDARWAGDPKTMQGDGEWPHNASPYESRPSALIHSSLPAPPLPHTPPCPAMPRHAPWALRGEPENAECRPVSPVTPNPMPSITITCHHIPAGTPRAVTPCPSPFGGR